MEMHMRIEGDEAVVVAGKNLAKAIPGEIESILNLIASETSLKMTEEAPKATGVLSRSIKVDSVPGRREIYPEELYGAAQEKGHGPQRRPPISKIYDWALAKGFSNPGSAAFLIARKIAQSGYPANPFIKRTYQWLVQQMNKFARQFVDKISVKYTG